MKRLTLPQRDDWQQRIRDAGLHFNEGAEPADEPYWNEGVAYEFTLAQIEVLETATNELHARCLDAVQHVMDQNRFAELQIPPRAVPMIRASWELEPPSIYGRFDLVYDGRTPPKMLEYNADTPTSLLEAAVVQWRWLEDVAPDADQFNAIHERLIATWRDFAPWLHRYHGTNLPVHFVSMDDVEDLFNVAYLADTAEQAGLAVRTGRVADIGWDETHAEFVDADEGTIATLFKLYPWEWIVRESFYGQLERAANEPVIIEPAWKQILSNKGILAILWELFPDHPNLLKAYREPYFLDAYAKKPVFSREGANVELVVLGESVAKSTGEYGEEGFVYQQLCELPEVDGHHPVIGSWIIGQRAAGIGIRESTGLITNNRARFTPHLIRG